MSTLSSMTPLCLSFMCQSLMLFDHCAQECSSIIFIAFCHLSRPLRSSPLATCNNGDYQ
ncbi:hypothetical protein SCLCIDRAFT_586721 [Scleroderma citrinum Foug A]|uniref:Uncharacterized protein n=1 Tax=Scleroderma citrinum Foug A TaxID=1036808 RepID=A0A0C2YQY5_9AGAM|nr:hypothetical protein SCLCIDRAFT_586721 [Scleroderma citrinum Foug A]